MKEAYELFDTAALTAPGADEMTEDPCRVCKTPVAISKGLLAYYGTGTTVCHSCQKKHDREHQYDGMGTTWERVCPPIYRETDKDHPNFNRAAYELDRCIGLDESVIYLGESGQCKTRLMMLRLKRALIKERSIKVLWQDEIREFARGPGRLDRIQRVCLADVLAMDDLFLAGASSDIVAEFIFAIVDRRFREKKPILVTSQITSEEFFADAGKFKNMTAAEQHRIQAVVRRVKEFCSPVDCNNESQGRIEF